MKSDEQPINPEFPGHPEHIDPELRARQSAEARKFSRRGTLVERARRHFLAGILVIIPAVIATTALVFLMDNSKKVFGGLVRGALALLPDPMQLDGWYIEWAVSIVSFIIAIIAVMAVGYFSTFFLVRRAISFGEGIVSRIPGLKFFYNTPKEVLHTFTASRKNSFKRVVMVEYPRRGMWCLAFATGEVILRPDNRQVVAIFLPTTPNPTSGFLIYVNADEVFDTNIPVEDGARMIISGGILSPPELSLQKFSSLEGMPALPPLPPLTVDPQQEAEPIPAPANGAHLTEPQDAPPPPKVPSGGS